MISDIEVRILESIGSPLDVSAGSTFIDDRVEPASSVLPPTLTDGRLRAFDADLLLKGVTEEESATQVSDATFG